MVAALERRRRRVRGVRVGAPELIRSLVAAAGAEARGGTMARCGGGGGGGGEKAREAAGAGLLGGG